MSRHAADDDYRARYTSADTPWDTGRPSVELGRVLAAGLLVGRTALEIGCGTGANALELARRGFVVTAADSERVALERARERARIAGLAVNFVLADVLTADLGGPFDVLFDRGLYHHLRHGDLGALRSALCRVTRPGTMWLSLSCSAREQYADPTPGVHEHDIRSELGELFDILELHEFRLETADPAFQPLAWSTLMRRR